MEIDVSIIILIIAIIGANSIILVKIFYNDEKDEEEKETQKNFSSISKYWEKPMDVNHEEILINNKNDLNKEIARESNGSNNEKIAKNKTEITNEKELTTKKSEYDIEIARNLEENENLSKPQIKRKIANESSIEVVEIIIEGKVYELTLKNNIIFTYNNENYSSYVLEIKHDNVKVKYRSQEKWVNFSDIKKIL